MRARLTFFAATAACIVGVAASAHADDRAIALRTDVEALSGTVRDTTITRTAVGASVALDVAPRLALSAGIRVGVLRIGFDSLLDEGLSGRGAIWSYADVSTELGLTARVLDSPRFTLDAFGEYETSLFGAEPEITALRIVIDEGRFDVTPYAGRNVGAGIFWDRIAAGARFRAVFGQFIPGISIAYQRIGATLDLRLTQEGRETIGQLGFDDARIEKRHALSLWSVPIVPEIGFALSLKSTIGIDATLMPAGDAWLFGTGAFYVHSF